MLLDALASFLLSYLLHSTVLLALALAAERMGLLRRLAPGLAETVWRWALFGALLTAGLQPLLARAPLNFGVSAPAHSAAPAALPSVTRAPQASPAPEAVAPAAQAVEVLPASPLMPMLNRMAGPLAVVWLAIGGSGFALLLAQRVLLARVVARMPFSEDASLQRFCETICRREGIQPPRIRISSRWTSPLVTPGGEVCLPLWAQALSPAQREAVLAHELAHLRRRDPAWRFAGHALARLAWLQPLNRLALQRLDTLAELACDDWAARTTGNGHALAESLYLCAQQHREARGRRGAPALAAAMSGRHSPLLKRMRSLMEEKPMEPGSTTRSDTRSARWAIAGGILLAAIALPAVVIRGVHAEDASILPDLGSRIATSLHINVGDLSVTRIETDALGGRLKINLHGKPQFTAAEDDVQSLQGSLEIEDKRGGNDRHLLIRSDGGKTLERVFQRNGQAVATMDAEDRRWLSEVIALLVDSTITPQQRVARLMKHGGMDAVFAYVEHSHNDYANRTTLEALFETGPLPAAAIERALLLTAKLNGDFERRSTLQTLATTQALSDAQQQAFLQVAATLDGAFERREALLSLTPKLSSAPAVLQAWVAAVQTMHGDFEARGALNGLMDLGQVTPARVDAALQAAASIDGDFEHRNALQSIAAHMDAAHPAQFQAYAESAARIGGAFERREALVTLLDLQGLDKPAYLSILKAAEGLDSGFELANVLQAVAEHMPADAELIARYRQLARGLGDFERGRAERALDRFNAS